MSEFKRALVTGGAGFIGSHLCDALVERGTEVVCMDNLETGDLRNIIHLRSNQLFQFFPGHVASSLNVSRAIEGCDVVFHQAALKMGLCKNIRTAMKYNVQGTQIVAEAAAKRGAVLVHASSGSVYGNSRGKEIAPTSIYGVSKAAGELVARMIYEKYSHVPVSILRYHHVYGPRQSADPATGGVVAIFIKQLLAGKPITIHGDGMQTRRFIHVKDVVNANLQAAKYADGCTAKNILGNERISIIQLAWLLAELTGVPRIDIKRESAKEGDIHDFDNYYYSNDYGQDIFLRDGLMNTIQYWQSPPERKE